MASSSLIEIHQRLVSIYGDYTVYVITVRRWIMHFNSGSHDVYDRPRSGLPCTAVNPRHGEDPPKRAYDGDYTEKFFVLSSLSFIFSVLSHNVILLVYLL